MRVAVVGAGVFGRNHLRVYRELEQAGFPVELAAVVDRDADAMKAAVDEVLRSRAFARLRTAWQPGKLDAASGVRADGASCGVRAGVDGGGRGSAD